MKQRFLVEQLEDRWVPTVTASVVNGVLLVRGPADGAVVITETAADTFQVTDNGNVVGTLSGATGIGILARDRGTAVNDNVTVNLNGNAVDLIFANLGAGNNSLTVEGGTVASDVFYRGGSGNDTLNIAAGTTVGGSVVARLGGGSNHVQVDGTIADNLVAVSRNSSDTVTVSSTGSVGGQTIERLGTRSLFSGTGEYSSSGSTTSSTNSSNDPVSGQHTCHSSAGS